MFEDLQELRRYALECEAVAEQSVSSSTRQHQLTLAQISLRIIADDEAAARFVNALNGTAAEPEQGTAEFEERRCRSASAVGHG
jgi:hypothetical protein